MNPIHKRGHGPGIGYDNETFSSRFDAICERQLKDGKAQAFSFIFYADPEFHRMLQNQGVFAKLDRLSGNKLSIFYLHSYTPSFAEKFNREFLQRLDLWEERITGNLSLPCIVFFRLKEGRLKDVMIHELYNRDDRHSFSELYEIVECYLETDRGPLELFPKWLTLSSKFIALETFRTALKAALEGVIKP